MVVPITRQGVFSIYAKWILEFKRISQKSAKEAGTKCANLGELMRIGMPVPPGFVVTSEAFDFFLKDTSAGEEIKERLREFTASPENLTEYEKLSQALCQIITGKDIPSELQVSISSAYDALCNECKTKDIPVAVRSSGCSEDLPTAAFAGQYDSYINVIGFKSLLSRVKDCWASLFTARAISYRLKNALSIMDMMMGVIVQKVVKVRSAGVAFTALPSTGNNSWVMIEGNWGTAESVVQGEVTPDKFYVNKETLEIEEKNIARKLRQYALNMTGTREEKIPEHKQSTPCFSDEEAVKIAEMAKQIESHYGTPQDIEWAIESDLPFPTNIFLVQTRPITTLQKKNAADQVVDLMLTRFIKR